MFNKLKPYLLFIVIIIGIIATIVLVQNQQDIRKQATGTTVRLSLNPSTGTLQTGSNQTVELWATFTGGTSSEKLDYFETVITFPKANLEVIQNIDVSPSGLNEILNVDLPSTANSSGSIKIQIGVVSPNDERPSTDQAMKIATIVFKATTPSSSAELSIVKSATGIVNNLSEYITLNDPDGATYTISGGINPSITTDPSQCTTGSYRCLNTAIQNCVNSNWVTTNDCADLGQTCSQTGESQPICVSSNLIKVGSIQFKVKPDVTGDARIDFSTTAESFVIERGGNDILGQITGLILNIIKGTEISPTPDPLAPDISFGVKFRGVSDQSGKDNPNQKVILRAKGDGVFKEYKDIPVTHVGNGVYLANNVNLAGLTNLDNITFFVKGPKHLAKEVGAAFPVPVQNPVIDWTSGELEGGDTIPQDGVVNSQDISRIIELLEVLNPNQGQLDVGDLNYDGVVNGADVTELILTLSTKKDED